MTLAFVVYLIGCLKPIAFMSLLLILAFIIFGVLSTIAYFSCGDEVKQRYDYKEEDKRAGYLVVLEKRYSGWIKKSIVGVVVFILTFIFVPSKEDGYLIAGAYMTQKVYESPETAKLQEKVLTILNAKLDEYIPKKETK